MSDDGRKICVLRRILSLRQHDHPIIPPWNTRGKGQAHSAAQRTVRQMGLCSAARLIAVVRPEICVHTCTNVASKVNRRPYSDTITIEECRKSGEVEVDSGYQDDYLSTYS